MSDRDRLVQIRDQVAAQLAEIEAMIRRHDAIDDADLAFRQEAADYHAGVQALRREREEIDVIPASGITGGGPCAACGHTPACGWSQINDEWLCHDDDHSCYTMAHQQVTWDWFRSRAHLGPAGDAA